MVLASSLRTTGISQRSSLFGFDWPLLALFLILGIWGCFTVASATQAVSKTVPSAQISPTPEFPEAAKAREAGFRPSDALKQDIFVVLGFAAMIALALRNYQWLMHLQGWVYGLNLLLLGLVLALPSSLAPEVNGAKSWIVLGPISLQMSEFSKIAVLIALSAFVARRQEKVHEWKTVLLSLLYLAPPLLLIMKQPDFGTAVATLSIWYGVLFFGGARLWHLGTVALVSALLFAGAWHGGYLRPHQKARLASFLNPRDKDRQGGYQLKQSLIAIGGGQITGQGYEQGMQNLAHYVPENQTDFIFTVVAEELGFAGAALLVVLYLLLLSRISILAAATENYFGVLICGGFISLLAFHCIVNLGMTMRVMPITGVPLPFFSYGGSSFLAFSLGAGLVQSVAIHRRR
jgi:rod shape determining protein RodA